MSTRTTSRSRAVRERRPLGELLERSEELALLGDLLADVDAAARGRFVFVHGEAGVGKTALVKRFCESRQPRRVLWGACDALFTPRPLGPFLDIAEEVGASFERARLDGARPYEFAAALMQELASETCIIVVEDVQWADEATLDVLRIVGRRVDMLSALIVMTYRDDEVDRRHPLRSLLAEAMVRERTTRIEVERLSEAAVGELAELSGADVDDLYRKTNGNPFFVSEVLASPGMDVPETAREAVLARASQLSAEGRELIEVVSLIHPRAEIWLLEALVPESLATLEECLSFGMLRAEREHVFFRHELARMAIEESLPLDRRRALNRQVVALLASPPIGEPDVARLAHHADEAGDADAVLRFARAAAEFAASVGAHTEAAEHYARALRFGNGLEPVERARLLECRSHECALTDQNSEAIAALQGALALYRELGDLRGEANVLRRLSTSLWCPGRVAEAEQAGRQAVGLLEGLDAGRELGLAYANMGMLARDASDSEAARAWGTRTLAEAERLDDLELRVLAFMTLGEVEMLAGQPSGRKRLELALGLAEQNGLVEAIGWIEGLLGRTLLHLRLYPAANTRLGNALTYLSDHGFELGRSYMLAYLARAELEQGRWAAAEEYAEEVLRVRRASTVPRIWALVVIALLRARRGEHDPWSPLDEARTLGDSTGELMRIGPVGAASAETAWLAGKNDEIVPLTDAAYALALKRRDPWLVGALAFWRSRAGLRQSLTLDIAEPYALQLAGESERAAEVWTQLGCPYEAALARTESGKETALRRSLVALQDLGARPAAAMVARQLRDRGARGLPRGPRPATRLNPAGLTPRQHEVLVLLARGLRNGEIAESLFLSVKTVDHHVASIMRKLGVHSRTAATSVAIERGIVGYRAEQ